MKVYQSRHPKLPGSSYDELAPVARKLHNEIARRTKRQPYVRSQYFRKDKVFISLFWEHLAQKHRGDRVHRLKLYQSAIDLLRNTTHEPDTLFSKDNLSIMLHRFYGRTKDGTEFCVQVKQDKRTGRKDFMSVFSKGKRQK